ncbi:hypothetical protein L2E82_38541 [Cichorium intybus]|uniref:Uncharacterized protein n=1 Tax=Cichorium intybus TaxID=13427 RepID=A0ACB9AFF5_CICIN|nr:hypothetical protein L2E82_38541 [Cichorium intybus]
MGLKWEEFCVHQHINQRNSILVLAFNLLRSYITRHGSISIVCIIFIEHLYFIYVLNILEFIVILICVVARGLFFRKKAKNKICQ